MLSGTNSVEIDGQMERGRRGMIADAGPLAGKRFGACAP